MQKYFDLAIWVAVAVVITAALTWITKDFHTPDEFLGILQASFQWLFFVPYLVGIIFGSNVHAPNMVASTVSLFIEVLLIVLAVRYIVLIRKKMN